MSEKEPTKKSIEDAIDLNDLCQILIDNLGEEGAEDDVGLIKNILLLKGGKLGSAAYELELSRFSTEEIQKKVKDLL